MAGPPQGRGWDWRPHKVLSNSVALGSGMYTSHSVLHKETSKGLSVTYLVVDISSKPGSFQKQKRIVFAVVPIVQYN